MITSLIQSQKYFIDNTFPLIFRISLICNNYQVNADSQLLCQLLDSI